MKGGLVPSLPCPDVERKSRRDVIIETLFLARHPQFPVHLRRFPWARWTEVGNIKEVCKARPTIRKTDTKLMSFVMLWSVVDPQRNPDGARTSQCEMLRNRQGDLLRATLPKECSASWENSARQPEDRRNFMEIPVLCACWSALGTGLRSICPRGGMLDPPRRRMLRDGLPSLKLSP